MMIPDSHKPSWYLLRRLDDLLRVTVSKWESWNLNPVEAAVLAIRLWDLPQNSETLLRSLRLLRPERGKDLFKVGKQAAGRTGTGIAVS